MRVAADSSPGPGIMATYVDILKSEFPEIDTELFDYITGERPGTDLPCAGDRGAVCRAEGAVQTGLKLPVGREAAALSFGANELTGLTGTPVSPARPGMAPARHGTAWPGMARYGPAD